MDWVSLHGPISGLDRIDQAFRDLMGDLEVVSSPANIRGAQDVVLSLPVPRQTAIVLVDVAREAHEATAAARDAIRARLQGSSGGELVGLWANVSGRLQAALSWIPRDRFRVLRRTAPGWRVTEFLQQLEMLNLAYLAVTRAWESAVGRAQEYAQLLDIHAELEIEHRRRDPGSAAVAALSLAMRPMGTKDEENAVKLLDAYLPLTKVKRGKYGGTLEDRQEDFPQDIRLRVVELVARLREHSPQLLLARLYDADADLTYLPHAATQDFINQREKQRRREELAPHIALGSEEEALSDQPDHATDPFAANRVEVDRLRDLVLRQFRHTQAEKRILGTLLTDPTIDPRERGSVSEIARKVGCRRETVSRYFAKLRAHNSSIFHPLLGS